MKYIITGVNKETKEQMAAILKTDTTRKSKLLLKLNAELYKQMNITLNDLEMLYVGKLDKHFKTEKQNG